VPSAGRAFCDLRMALRDLARLDEGIGHVRHKLSAAQNDTCGEAISALQMASILVPVP
jgi:hypothetical protein